MHGLELVFEPASCAVPVRLLSTASFLADFAFEAGLPTPPFFLTRDPVTEKRLGSSVTSVFSRS